MGLQDLPLFVLSGLLLNLTPGADSLFIISRSAAGGWRLGSAAALGVGAGCLLHVAAAALGLSALLATSSMAFTVIKWLGAAYLIAIGVSMLWSTRGGDAAAGDRASATPIDSATTRWSAVFAQGLLTNALNPKVALFFLAFMPPFISDQAPDKGWAFLVLGLIFTFNGTLWCLALAALASRARAIRLSPGLAAWLVRAAGGLFVLLGLRLALSSERL